MKINAKKYEHCPENADDPRVTRIGKWLRKLSIDEIPQLINVFKGEMSLVGPRPEMPFIVDTYEDSFKTASTKAFPTLPAPKIKIFSWFI